MNTIEIYMNYKMLNSVLQNPTGEAIICDHNRISNARIACLDHDAKMSGLVAQMYSVSKLTTIVWRVHISSCNCNCIQFISKWYETLRILINTAHSQNRVPFILV